MRRYCLALGCIVAWVALPVRADPDPMVQFQQWQRARPELRDGVPHAVWSLDLESTWRLRSGCLARLRADGVSARLLEWTPNDAPDVVVIDEVPGGVAFQKRRAHAPLAISCALARRLPRMATVLREHSVHRVEVLSAYRREPAVSYHTMGLALDLTRFWTDDGEVLEVQRDWSPRPDQATCREPLDSNLQRLACALADASIFSTVITPNYGRGHDDHFHVDIRPDDPWRYVR